MYVKCFDITYFFAGSFLLKSSRSGIRLNDTRHTRPSSSKRAMCDGPKATRLILFFKAANAAGDVIPIRFNFSETSFNLQTIT